MNKDMKKMQNMRCYKYMLVLAIVFCSGCAGNTVQISPDECTGSIRLTNSLYVNPDALGMQNSPNISINTSRNNTISVDVKKRKAKKRRNSQSKAF